MSDLQKAAQAVLDRWDSPKWEWVKQGPTAALMTDLRKALDKQHTHAENCWSWGPAHYECALRKIGEMING